MKANTWRMLEFDHTRIWPGEGEETINQYCH